MNVNQMFPEYLNASRCFSRILTETVSDSGWRFICYEFEIGFSKEQDRKLVEGLAVFLAISPNPAA